MKRWSELLKQVEASDSFGTHIGSKALDEGLFILIAEEQLQGELAVTNLKKLFKQRSEQLSSGEVSQANMIGAVEEIQNIAATIKHLEIELELLESRLQILEAKRRIREAQEQVANQQPNKKLPTAIASWEKYIKQ